MIAAEAGGRELRACMSGMPCGCDEIARAERNGGNDPGILAGLIERGKAMQRAWQCPAAGFDIRTQPPDEAAETLRYVDNALGVSGFTTCPMFTTRLPWVSRVIELYSARKLGLRSAMDPEPSLVTVEGLLALDSAITRRRVREDKRRAAAVARNEKPEPDDDD